MPGTLYLIPNSLGSQDPDMFLAPKVKSIITGIRHLVVENIRNARRYLKLVDSGIDIDAIEFMELNKHTPPERIKEYLGPLLQGHDMGMISEAGLPGVADPGATLARYAHEKDLPVVPLTGPSSLFLSLMASGLNGQSFRFSGYLSVKRPERIRELKDLEQRALKMHETQIFMETPYRNNSLLSDILHSCGNDTMLTIAADITTETEFIKTRSIGAWKKKKPDLHKRPAVFLLGR